jgi:hypothetical protein
MVEKKSFEDAVREGIKFVGQFLPGSGYLIFPLLSAALAWAVKSSEEWDEKIFSWRIWLDPHSVKVKPDEFILDFFSHHPDLCRFFAGDIKKKDMVSLRGAFKSLYPILGLEDPFLTGLFRRELESKDYRKIVAQFKRRTAQAVSEIESIDSKARFMEGLEAVAREMVSLGSALFTDKSAQKALAEIIKKEIEEKND